MNAIAILVLVLAVVAGPCTACSVDGSWRPQGILRRMESAPVVFSGKVTKLHRPSRAPGQVFLPGDLYEATFDVDCVYKSGDGVVLGTVRVSELGTDAHGCFYNPVEEGESYLVFTDGDFEVFNINMQNAVTEVSDTLTNRVESEYTCNTPA